MKNRKKAKRPTSICRLNHLPHATKTDNLTQSARTVCKEEYFLPIVFTLDRLDGFSSSCIVLISRSASSGKM